MNKNTKLITGRIGIVLFTALAAPLAGCIGYVHEPRQVYSPPPPVYAQPAPVYVESAPLQDDYVYYPSYQVYYSGRTRQYVYLEGRSWVSRPAPPRVSVDVLFASPSVRLGFHDHPASHHATIVRQYPKRWTPTDQRRERERRYDDRDPRFER